MEGDSSGPVATERVSTVGAEPSLGPLVLEEGSFALVDSPPLGTRISTESSSREDSPRVAASNPLAIARTNTVEDTNGPKPKEETPRVQSSKRLFCIACALLMAFFVLVVCLAVTFTSELSYTTTGEEMSS